MKKLILVLFLSFLWVSSFAKGETETIVIKTSILCDHCLKCESCGQNINFATRKVKGVTKMKIDPKANTIIVTYRTDKTNPDQIRKAISVSGYDADHIKADPIGYQKLDGCCKKK